MTILNPAVDVTKDAAALSVNVSRPFVPERRACYSRVQWARRNMVPYWPFTYPLVGGWAWSMALA